MSCDYCQAVLEENAHFCGQCGRNVDAQKYCFNCGFQIKDDVRYCSNCGQVISDSKSEEALKDKLLRLEKKLKSESRNFSLMLEIANIKNSLGDIKEAQEDFEYILLNSQSTELQFETSYKYGRMLSENEDSALLKKSVELLMHALDINPDHPKAALIRNAVDRIKLQLSNLENKKSS